MKQNGKPTALIMIFGATGDLAKRKLFPSIYNLYTKGKLERFAVIGVARRPLSTKDFQTAVKIRSKHLMIVLQMSMILFQDFTIILMTSLTQVLILP